MLHSFVVFPEVLLNEMIIEISARGKMVHHCLKRMLKIAAVICNVLMMMTAVSAVETKIMLITKFSFLHFFQLVVITNVFCVKILTVLLHFITRPKSWSILDF